MNNEDVGVGEGVLGTPWGWSVWFGMLFLGVLLTLLVGEMALRLTSAEMLRPTNAAGVVPLLFFAVYEWKVLGLEYAVKQRLQ